VRLRLCVVVAGGRDEVPELGGFVLFYRKGGFDSEASAGSSGWWLR